MADQERCPRCRTLGMTRMIMCSSIDGEDDTAEWKCYFCGHRWRQPLWRVP